VEKCPKCGSADRREGKLFPRGENRDVGYRDDDAFILSFKKRVTALACLSCGHIELFLRDEVDRPVQE
jgi:predicted nucleic-acid-binding Zn-ribbon protein